MQKIGSLFNYYREEPSEAEIANGNGAIILLLEIQNHLTIKLKL